MTFHRPLDPPDAILNGFDPEEGDNTTNGPYRIIGRTGHREVPLDRLRAGTMTDEEALHVAAKTLRLLHHPHVQEHGPEVLQALSARLERVQLAPAGAEAATKRSGAIVGKIRQAAWELLAMREQAVLIALDDFEAGRFDLEELKQRLVHAQAEEVADLELSGQVAAMKLDRIARHVREGREDLALEYVRINLLGQAPEQP